VLVAISDRHHLDGLVAIESVVVTQREFVGESASIPFVGLDERANQFVKC
jgi:hypothetical protein